MKKIDELLNQRAERIILISTATVKKIVKKELNKFKKELIKNIIGGGK